MKRVFFFATPTDLDSLLARFESNEAIKFIKDGHQDAPNPTVYKSSKEIPLLGVSSSETGSTSDTYLVLFEDNALNIKTYISADPLHSGQERWSVNNGMNSDSVVLTLGGLWGKDILVPGNVSTLHDSKAAQQLMKHFSVALKKEGFVKILKWWIGKEALEMLRSGKRLTTTGVQSPPEYDLALPQVLKR